MTALFVVLERDISDFDPYVKGRALSDSERKLEQLSKELNVTPLMNFFGQHPEDAAAFIEGEGGDPDEIDIPDEAWFDATDGLRTIETLLEHLGTNPDALPNTDGVIAELKEWKTVLKRADAEGIAWHLEVEY